MRRALLFALTSLFFLTACESETVFDRRRAVPAPQGQASTEHEILGSPDAGVPLLTIDLPNTKEDTPHVRTFLDNAAATTQEFATTRPSGPATTAPANPTIAPIPEWEQPADHHGAIQMIPTGTRPASATSATSAGIPATAAALKLLTLRKPDDHATIANDAGTLLLTVTSPSGIGDATLAPTAGTWPTQLTLRLRYAPDKPFKSLEGFTATLDSSNPDAKPIGLKVTLQKVDGALDSIRITLPPNPPKDAAQLHLSWIDAYRQ